ncbi:MAG TPA: ABC transporter ATP-binding protein [Marinilabiliaceae bacterium]|nr:ABC transporter ATP-binding protein [Marinilabiliaceae bacterium]
MSKVLINIEQLQKKYPSASEYSLKGVSFSVYEGEIFGVFGPNGAGKTTLISILCNILPFTHGDVRFYTNGNLLSLHEIKQQIGFIPQELAIYEDLTAFQNVEYFGALYNLTSSQIKQRSSELFHLLGLENVRNKKVKTFSGGMKRRLNLIVGVVHQPKILFLDEPTVGVDIHSRNAILSFLKDVNQKGTTIIYTSHHLDEAEQLCDRIAIIDHGEIIALDHIENLLHGHDANCLTQLLLKLTGKEFRDNV